MKLTSAVKLLRSEVCFASAFVGQTSLHIGEANTSQKSVGIRIFSLQKGIVEEISIVSKRYRKEAIFVCRDKGCFSVIRNVWFDK